MKNYLKNNRNHTAKQILGINYRSYVRYLFRVCFLKKLFFYLCEIFIPSVFFKKIIFLFKLFFMFFYVIIL